MNKTIPFYISKAVGASIKDLSQDKMIWFV